MELDFKKGGGMLPAVVQEAGTGKVLMLGYMNPEAYRKTLESRNVTFFSRSQNKLWMKGESSGHVLKVKEVLVDCDLDSLVVIAEQLGPGTCHEGYRTCFFSAPGSISRSAPAPTIPQWMMKRSNAY